MSNLRVIYDNAADRATLSSSATATGLPVANLQSDLKSKVCRSTGTTLTLTLTWPAAEVLSGVALALTNLTAAHTVRAQVYINTGDSSPAFDSGAVLGGAGIMSSGGVNTFAYGGGNYSSIWFNSIVGSKLVITISDPTNTQGYVEVSRLIVGSYWQPRGVGVEIGSTNTMEDTSQHFRTDGGDLITYVGTKHRKQSLSLPSIDPVDRAYLWKILWNNGMSKPLYISLSPQNADAGLEQANQLYGKLSTSPSMKTAYYMYNSATIDIEEI